MKVNSSHYTQWMSGEFNYTKVPLRIIIEDIERWFGVTINNYSAYHDEEITMFAKKKDINDVMDVLEKILNINFINEGGGIYDIE